MSIKQTMRNLMAGLFLVFGIALFIAPVSVFADCGTVQTSIIDCGSGVDTDKDGNGEVDVTETAVGALLLMVINILTAGVGVVALAGIVYGSILYTSAGGSQEQVKKAVNIFTNVVIGVIAFAGMWALLNYLIPGGVF